MNCPGSIQLLDQVGIQRSTDEPSYRRDGSTAHAGALWCLENNADAWEIMGMVFEGQEFTDAMALGVQAYLDAVRADITPDTITYFEQQIEDPAVHHNFYGTTDCGVVAGDTLIVSDYKNGAGIPVDVAHNPQVMYYAYGLLRKVQDERVTKVKLRIVQPNAFHPAGPKREWEISADDLCRWAETELVPAMQRTETDTTLEVGSHCRFCPARLVCPALRGLYGAFVDAKATDVQRLTDAELGRQYVLIEAVQIRIKALRDETLRRLLAGAEVDGAKLVEKKADRVYRDGARERFYQEFGAEAFTEPGLKSPAQMEKLPGAKVLVQEWAYSPKTGYTVDLATSKRCEVKVTQQTGAEAFAEALKELDNGNSNG